MLKTTLLVTTAFFYGVAIYFCLSSAFVRTAAYYTPVREVHCTPDKPVEVAAYCRALPRNHDGE